MTARCVGTILLLASLVSCRGIGGTYDQSRSVVRRGEVEPRGVVAVIGPPESADLPGLAEALQGAVVDAVRLARPDRDVLSSHDFYERLQRHRGYFEHFGDWLARYAQTGFVDQGHFAAYAKASRTRYLLLLKDMALRRERIDVRTAVEEAGCGMGCWVWNAKSIWGNRLIVIAELHDLQRAEVAWKGVGQANAISSRVEQLDFGLVQYNLRQPEMGAYSDQLVAHVATGIARELDEAPLR
jgi:hypothetical protein